MSIETVELATRAPEECGDCGERLRKVVAAHEGVAAAAVSGSGQLEVSVDLASCSTACLGAVLEQARETLAFVETLRESVDVPVVTYDERFTSSLAGGDDARAAAYILSSYLEWLGET